MQNFNNFHIYSIRTLNQTINETINYPSGVFLPNQAITQKGRNSFGSFYKPFDSIDFIGVQIGLQFQTEYLHSNYNIDGTILIHVLSNSTNNYESRLLPLDKNISITFDVPENINITSTSGGDIDVAVDFMCVWYNGTTQKQSFWSDFGCSTTVNYNRNDEIKSIICECNHMTTFGILWHLQQSENDNENDLLNQYSQHWGYGIILSLFTLSFLCVSCYILKLFYILRIKYQIPITICYYKNKQNQPCEAAFAILFFSLTQSIGQTISCFVFLIYAVIFPLTDDNFDNFSDSNIIYDFFREFLTFGLFLPMISSFYIYTCVIYGLAIVSNSLVPKIESIRRKTFKIAIGSNIFITIFLFAFALCLIFDIAKFADLGSNSNSNSGTPAPVLFFCGELFYIFLQFVVLCFASYFTYGAHKTIKSTLSLFDESNKDEAKQLIKSKKTLNRILFSSFVLVLLLSCQILSLLIFVINPKLFHVSMQMFEIFLNLLYLIFVLKFYNKYFQAKISDKLKQS